MDKEAITSAINKARKGIDQYVEIMTLFPIRDVSSDKEFQRKFNGFYRIRQRNQQFYNTYYKLMQDLKGNIVNFSDVIEYLYQASGRFEPSFSSKLIATHNPNMPIWDSIVLKNIGIKPPAFHARDRLSKIKRVYADIINWYGGYLSTDEAKLIIDIFDTLVDKPFITNLKKIDFVLWQTRTKIKPKQPTYTSPTNHVKTLVADRSQGSESENDVSVIGEIKSMFFQTGNPSKIPMLRGDRSITAEFDEQGIWVDNLGNQPFLPWIVFQETINILHQNGGKAKRGNAMNCKLGEPGLQFNSIEGHIAHVVYGKQVGDTVFRRITPIACILIWARVCRAVPGELILI